jgi:hypothetical protein
VLVRVVCVGGWCAWWVVAAYGRKKVDGHAHDADIVLRLDADYFSRVMAAIGVEGVECLKIVVFEAWARVVLGKGDHDRGTNVTRLLERIERASARGGERCAGFAAQIEDRLQAERAREKRATTTAEKRGARHGSSASEFRCSVFRARWHLLQASRVRLAGHIVRRCARGRSNPRQRDPRTAILRRAGRVQCDGLGAVGVREAEEVADLMDGRRLKIVTIEAR